MLVFSSNSFPYSLTLLRSVNGFTGVVYSTNRRSPILVMELENQSVTDLGLQGMRSPTLFLDCIGAVLSTLMWNQQNIVHCDGSADVTQAPLSFLREGFTPHLRRRLLERLLNSDYCSSHLWESANHSAVSSSLNPEIPPTIHSDPENKEKIWRACEPLFPPLRPVSEVERKVRSYPLTGLSPFDQSVFEKSSRPTLLSPSNPHSGEIASLFHEIVCFLSGYSTCIPARRISFVAIEALYKQATRLLMLLNSYRVRSQLSWEALGDVQKELASLALSIQPAEMDLEEVVDVGSSID